uniref:DNA repair protein complementing XP-C cells homolog n=1 Tax=Culex pipiens TaxID=7175 RepID=A0A8D8BPB6_CULPI
MNRARRSVTVKKKVATPPANSDDDFESEVEESGADFSASEDEWLPGEGDKKKKGGTESDGEESAEVDEDEEEDDPSGDGSGSDESVVATKKAKVKRSGKGSPKQPAKKKRMSPKTRDELYSRTKKYLLKERDPELPPLNSSVSDILKSCQFQKKKNFTASQGEPKRLKPVARNDESESSGDEHLINPEKLDLNSDFFNRQEKLEERAVAVPQFDCNAGMNLSDSSDGEEASEGKLPASIPKLAADQLISKINESSSGFMNFNNLGEFNKKIQEAKDMLKNYQTKESQEGKEEDVSNLLALGEAEAGVSPGKIGQASQPDIESEESDWEEVEEARKSQASEGKQAGDADYQITVEVEGTKTKKKRWEEIEMELYIKRQINKVKREKQLAYHKSSVLCCIAEGRKLNEIVGSGRIQAMMLSCMQAKQCMLKGKVDVKFVDQLMGWFKDTFQLTSQQMLGEKQSSLKFTLALELFTRKVSCKRYYVLLFLACLRAAGIHCRLVISANAPPKRPAMKDLCPISERQLIEQFEREFKGKIRSGEDSAIDTSVKEEDTTVEVKEEAKEEVEEKQSDKKPAKSARVPKVRIEKLDVKTNETAEASPDKKPARSARIPKVLVEKLEVKTRSRSRSQTAKADEQSRKLRFSPEPELLGAEPKSATPSPSKENPKTRKSILKTRASPRNASRKALNTLNIPQLDGMDDIPASSPRRRNLRSHDKTAKPETSTDLPFTKRNTNTPQATTSKQIPKQPGRVSKRKLFTTTKTVEPESEPAKKPKPTKNKILSSDSEPEQPKSQSSPALSKKRKAKSAAKADPESDDSDFEPVGDKRKKVAAKRTRVRSETPEVKRKKSAPARKGKKKVAVEDKEADISNSAVTNKTDVWIEFYAEKEKQWKTVDLFAGKVDCAEYLARHATAPISYVFGFDNAGHIKDVTPRYVQHWNTVCRKSRVEQKWLEKALKPFLPEKSDRDEQENADLNKIDLDKPLPTTIAECKNHPLYVLKRHLLKFEALYPVEVPSLGFVRGEAIYARECVFVLQTREKWYKQGRVVKPFETAYKVVKCWRYDKEKNEWLGNQPCDIFGIWQTDEYDPPTAENGVVPRNEYGNVELFTPKMLPKKTVHLQLPGLNRVCGRLGIDCAPALTGFEMARKRMIPVYDGFVVCEEFGDQVTEEWYKQMEEEERREQEKLEKRVYGNWKKLIRGVLVRRKLQNKYNFDNL